MDAGITVTKTDAKFAVSTLFERILKFDCTTDFLRYIQFQFMVINLLTFNCFSLLLHNQQNSHIDSLFKAYHLLILKKHLKNFIG